MSPETHGRWPWVAAGLVVPMWSSAAARRGELLEEGLWVAGLALPILVSHQSEDWVWPGGFLPFCNRRLLGSDRPDWPLTERDGFHVNVTFGWCSAVAGLALWRRTPLGRRGRSLDRSWQCAHACRHGRSRASVQPWSRDGHHAHGSPRGCRRALGGSLRASRVAPRCLGPKVVRHEDLGILGALAVVPRHAAATLDQVQALERLAGTPSGLDDLRALEAVPAHEEPSRRCERDLRAPQHSGEAARPGLRRHGTRPPGSSTPLHRAARRLPLDPELDTRVRSEFRRLDESDPFAGRRCPEEYHPARPG
jgi:hypothetical protein